MPSFTPCPRSHRINWSDEHGSFWMSLEQAKYQLGLFFEAGAIVQALDLWDAVIAIGGRPSITYGRAA